MTPVAAMSAVHAYGYGSMHDNGGHPGLWVFGGLILILLVAAGALLVWAVVRRSNTAPPPPPDPHGRAREILAERFARGEISSEEFRERSEHLT